MTKPAPIPLDYVPKDAADMVRCLEDPMWRVASGQLYRIVTKSPASEGGTLSVPFRPNAAQMALIRSLWTRSLILKARQLGMTSLIAILWLDHALFTADQRCGIIAQDREAAEAIFRDKVRYAYLHLPATLRQAFPLGRDSASELLFAHNNSSIRVATSMRSGTIHRLHVSEFGKICAKFPDKAVEVVTGSLPAVPLDGIAIIESTAEGQEGEFYEMARRAEALHDARKTLTPRDYRFHFYAWHDNPEYAMDPAGVIITAKDHEYFDGIQAKIGRPITPRQRAWYCATRGADFAGQPELMWREYPSLSSECFQASTEGTYYAVQMTAARASGRIGRVPMVSGVPVNTFWDIGNSDGTAIWFHQKVGAEHRFIDFEEAWGEPYSYFIAKMQARGWVWGRHFLPHDAMHQRQQGTSIASPIEMLQGLAPGWRFEIVPRVDELQHGIQKTRDSFGQCWFDETACAAGLEHLAMYRKSWNDRLGVWSDKPRKDVHTEACFVAGTPITTERGIVPIEAVTTSDRVWTPKGYAKVYNAGPVKRAASLLTVTTADGREITCTPEHKFFTNAGLVAASELQPGHVLLSCIGFWWRMMPDGFRESFLRLHAFRRRWRALLRREGAGEPRLRAAPEAQPVSSTQGRVGGGSQRAD